MKKKTLLILILIGICSLFSYAEDLTPVEKANYKLAARFSPPRMKKMIFDTGVDAHWLKHSQRFWYSMEGTEGKFFAIVDPVKKTKEPLFDNAKMAAMLTELTKDPYEAKHLPIEKIKFVKEDTAIRFEVESSQEEKTEEEEDEIEQEEKEKKEERQKEKKPKKKVFYFEYTLADGKLRLLEDYEKEPEKPDWANISPDESIIVFARDHNLFWMDRVNYEKYLEDKEDEEIEEHQLTEDGEKHYSYARTRRGQTNVDEEKDKGKRQPVNIIWSHDSKKFAMIRSDERKVNNLWVINAMAQPRPALETYKYSMPGEEHVPQREILVFDMESQEKTEVDSARFKDQYVSIFTAPRKPSTRDDDHRPALWLSETSDKLYFSRTSRNLHRVDICVADTATGKAQTLIEERLNTYVEFITPALIDNGREIIHWSERDGWGHFYLYDGNGKLKNQITSGPFHCDNIAGVDEENRVLFFNACGREEGEDPYYMHLYRINFDGTGLKQLNPGNFNHSVSMNDSRRYFVNNFSRVDTVPKAVLRDHQGNHLLDLETADLSLLMEAGYQFPETFKVKADDGVTDLYGVMHKPFDFDETKKYPIIAYVYPGPQTESVSKAFAANRGLSGLAQFGFVVITVGNRGGHPNRSKWYHNYGYGNLRDYGLADKKTAIEQLAARHSFIDIDKVGIFGHSGGGFMSTAAMLVYPDFFKVAVSSAGNHENNIYNTWWSEKHHGVKEVKDEDGNITFEYEIDTNSELAENLKGRLLLTTGDIDNNVHPANTFRMAHALIKANKRFDFFIFPGQRHGFGDMSDYWFWLRGDYFCKHLIGDFSQSVDMVELNRDKEMTGDK
ncbi:MAG: DPP IV N-terminal domain-containing protein [Candidatus Aminicenantaceae bacterium]